MADQAPEKTWAERNAGWEHCDSVGRWVGLRYSRFHGLMVCTDQGAIYIDTAEPAMREWLATAPAIVPATADDEQDIRQEPR